MLDDRRVGQAGVRSPDLVRDFGMSHAQALHVGFVDDGVVVFVAGRAIVAPVEERVHDHRMHGVLGRVLLVV